MATAGYVVHAGSETPRVRRIIFATHAWPSRTVSSARTLGDHFCRGPITIATKIRTERNEQSCELHLICRGLLFRLGGCKSVLLKAKDGIPDLTAGFIAGSSVPCLPSSLASFHGSPHAAAADEATPPNIQPHPTKTRQGVYRSTGCPLFSFPPVLLCFAGVPGGWAGGGHVPFLQRKPWFPANASVKRLSR